MLQCLIMCMHAYTHKNTGEEMFLPTYGYIHTCRDILILHYRVAPALACVAAGREVSEGSFLTTVCERGELHRGIGFVGVIGIRGPVGFCRLFLFFCFRVLGGFVSRVCRVCRAESARQAGKA